MPRLSLAATLLVSAALFTQAYAEAAPAKKPAAKRTAATKMAVVKVPVTKPGAAVKREAAVTESVPEPAESPASVALGQAYEVYRTTRTPEALSQVLQAFRQLLADTSGKVPAAAMIKAYPALAELGARAIDAGNGRVWVFSKLVDNRDAILQWADTKTSVIYGGRRKRTRRVVSTSQWRSARLELPTSVSLSDARIFGSNPDDHTAVLVGADNSTGLWLRTYRLVDGRWLETTGRLDTVPSFLTQNVSGKVSFRGADLIFTIGRMVPAHSAALTRLPEAESSTYRFWLRNTDQGYVLMTKLPDEDQFVIVRQFLDAIAGGRTDVAKSLLLDAKLLSIPKYVGVQAGSDSYRVAQMASPPSGAARYRLITGGKDDLIFEVIRHKDRQVIRAIFIASPDPFLKELGNRLPTYDKVGIVPAPDVPAK